ncbi:MAG: hypothetical protein AAF613_08440 [Pseudomonadota bacterium]
MIEKRVTLGLVLALLIQSASALTWAGGAAQRIEALEVQVASSRPVGERLARVEAELEALRAQLSRIEDKIDQL